MLENDEGLFALSCFTKNAIKNHYTRIKRLTLGAETFLLYVRKKCINNMRIRSLWPIEQLRRRRDIPIAKSVTRHV